MTQRRIFATTFAAIFAMGVFASSANADEEAPCKSKKFEFKKVEAACKSGGEKAAKTLMKSMVKKAKAGGKDWKCTECHPKANETDKLKPGASDKLKEWI
jgi:hypothetical protein